MLKELRNEANIAYTENGAVTNASTMSDCLDLFSTAGALRQADEEEILRRFIRAFAEDRDIALKILFFARDIRGGLGERRLFRVILKYLADREPQTVRKNLGLVAEYGRFDDLLAVMGTACEKDALEIIRAQLTQDMEALQKGAAVSLLAKWLPSVNTSAAESCALGRRIAGACGMKEKEYRRTLSALRKQIGILENSLRERDYTFDYEKQPSRALFKYRKAFMRNDGERYNAFLQAVSKGSARMHADNVYPYELVDPYLGWDCYTTQNRSFMRCITDEEKAVLNAAWASLPAFDTGENALAVIDTSGSMYESDGPKPASVALSLGLYFAEHNHGEFADHFIMFSEKPQLIELKGNTFADRLRYAASFCEIGNTDIEAVFKLVLRTAVKNHLPQEELPSKLVIISDMEFDRCTRNASCSNFENARQMYEEMGYRLPQLVFWNVESRHRQQPVRMNAQGAALVSGCTPRLFSMVAGDVNDPYSLMMEVIGSERYARIAA